MTIREAVEADINRRMFAPFREKLAEWKRKDILERLLHQRMIYACGRHGEKYYNAKNVVRVTPEIIQMDCPECGGDGDWGKFLFNGPNAETYAEAFNIELPYIKGTMPCIDCKGTGRVYA